MFPKFQIDKNLLQDTIIKQYFIQPLTKFIFNTVAKSFAPAQIASASAGNRDKSSITLEKLIQENAQKN